MQPCRKTFPNNETSAGAAMMLGHQDILLHSLLWHLTAGLLRTMQGNKLGQAFAEATELVRAQSWHDLFDTSVIEIAHGDVERFKQEVLRVAAELL